MKANNEINQIDLHCVSFMRDIYTGLAIQQPSSEPQWADGLGLGFSRQARWNGRAIIWHRRPIGGGVDGKDRMFAVRSAFVRKRFELVMIDRFVQATQSIVQWEN
jgi:hypothetical protein